MYVSRVRERVRKRRNLLGDQTALNHELKRFVHFTVQLSASVNRIHRSFSADGSTDTELTLQMKKCRENAVENIWNLLKYVSFSEDGVWDTSAPREVSLNGSVQ